jgi:hypothetical protein
VRSAPGILEASPDQLAVGIRASPTCPRVEVADQDHREGGASQSAQVLVALGDLDLVEGMVTEGALLFQMRVDEPECLAAQRHIYRTLSSQEIEVAGGADGHRGAGLEIVRLLVGECRLGSVRASEDHVAIG